MIVYDPFWNTLNAKGISQYTLIKDFHIRTSLLARLRANKPISSITVDQLCEILSCNVEDIMTYKKDR